MTGPQKHTESKHQTRGDMTGRLGKQKLQIEGAKRTLNFNNITSWES